MSSVSNKSTFGFWSTYLGGESSIAANMNLTIVAAHLLIAHLCFTSSAVLADRFVLRKSRLRQAPKRHEMNGTL